VEVSLNGRLFRAGPGSLFFYALRFHTDERRRRAGDVLRLQLFFVRSAKLPRALLDRMNSPGVNVRRMRRLAEAGRDMNSNRS